MEGRGHHSKASAPHSEVLSQDMSSQQKRKDKKLSPYLGQLARLQEKYVRNGKNPLLISDYKAIIERFFPSQDEPDKRIFERNEKGNNIFYYLMFAEGNAKLDDFFKNLWKIVQNLMDENKISRSPLHRITGVRKFTPFERALRENTYYAKLMLPYLLDIHRYDEGTLQIIYNLTKIIQENACFSLEERMNFYFSFLNKLIKNYDVAYSTEDCHQVQSKVAT